MTKKADIYTGTGDKGTTGLFGGSRVDKDSVRVEAYGTVDELCSVIGVVKASGPDVKVRECLSELQRYCYTINSELAADEQGQHMLSRTVDASDVTKMEVWIDEFSNALPKLNHFIVPGESQATAFLNLARTVCRRAERRLWRLSREAVVNKYALTFLNRMSDLLFTLMRYEDLQRGAQEQSVDTIG